jgi:phosphoenolpyruvate---glycerone phosphotransferase subunit DhaL
VSPIPFAPAAVPATVGASDIRAFIVRAARTVERHQATLTRLDAVLGDGDHGDNMVIGFHAVLDLLESLPGDTSPGDVLRAVGYRLVAAVGGASGPLYGTAFIEAGFTAGDGATLDGPRLATMLIAAADGLARRGRCGVGDKTILDALRPAADAFEGEVERGGSVTDACVVAVHASRTGMLSSRGLIARRGLALRLGERSAGTLDPGAVSCFLILRSLLPGR